MAESLSDFKQLPVPNLGYGNDEGMQTKFWRVWHSPTQRNPEEFVVEEVDTKIVKAKSKKEAMNKIRNTYKQHALKAEEITDQAEIDAIKQSLFEKKVGEVV